MSSFDVLKMNIRHVAGRIFLIDTNVDNGTYHKPIVINETGEKIIEHLKQGEDIRVVAEIIAKEYSIDPLEILEDIKLFIKSIELDYKLWQ